MFKTTEKQKYRVLEEEAARIMCDVRKRQQRWKLFMKIASEQVDDSSFSIEEACDPTYDISEICHTFTSPLDTSVITFPPNSVSLGGLVSERSTKHIKSYIRNFKRGTSPKEIRVTKSDCETKKEHLDEKNLSVENTREKAKEIISPKPLKVLQSVTNVCHDIKCETSGVANNLLKLKTSNADKENMIKKRNNSRKENMVEKSSGKTENKCNVKTKVPGESRNIILLFLRKSSGFEGDPDDIVDSFHEVATYTNGLLKKYILGMMCLESLNKEKTKDYKIMLDWTSTKLNELRDKFGSVNVSLYEEYVKWLYHIRRK